MLKANQANILSVCIFPLEGKRTHIHCLDLNEQSQAGVFGGKKTYNLCEVKRMRKNNSWPEISISRFMLIPENGQLQATVDSQNQFPEGKAVLSQSPGIYVLMIPERKGIWESNTKRILGVTAPSAARDSLRVTVWQWRDSLRNNSKGHPQLAAFQKIKVWFQILPKSCVIILLIFQTLMLWSVANTNILHLYWISKVWGA